MQWLASSATGLRVVTGEPGSGKSALLGHLFVLADDDLVRAYVDTGLAPQLESAPRPPGGAFDAAVHLTGKSSAERYARSRGAVAWTPPAPTAKTCCTRSAASTRR